MAAERRAEVLSAMDVGRALTRVSHEVVERNSGVSTLVLVGMQRGGVWIAEHIARSIAGFEGHVDVPVGSIDVSMYRDDIALRPVVPAAVTDSPVDITGKTVVLVDDVLFTGRTVRAALDALLDHGRPRAVQLAVLVDRGHRELPIRPDFVGKNIPTHVSDEVDASLQGVFVLSAIADIDGGKRVAS